MRGLFLPTKGKEVRGCRKQHLDRTRALGPLQPKSCLLGSGLAQEGLGLADTCRLGLGKRNVSAGFMAALQKIPILYDPSARRKTPFAILVCPLVYEPPHFLVGGVGFNS